MMELPENDEEESTFGNEEEREKLYQTVLHKVQATLDSISRLQLDAENSTASLQSEFESKQAREHELTEKFHKFQKDIIAKAKLSAKNDSINPTVVAEFEEDERVKRQEINDMRLSLIKTKLQVQKLGKKLKSKERSDDEEGVIGFEQLKVENQSLNTKLTHRQKEIKRLRDKLEQNACTVSKMKNDIEATIKESKEKTNEIQSVEKEISVCGAKLSKLVLEHKEIEKTHKIQSVAAANKIVQENYYSSVKVVEDLTTTLNRLKRQHQELTN